MKFLLLLTVLLFSSAHAQSLRPLRPGDTLPPLSLPLVGGGDSLWQGEQGKPLTVLGFWTPQCSFSSGQLAVMDTLQRAFPSRLHLLPVGFDAHEAGSVRQFWYSHRKGSESLLPTAVQGVSDTLLNRLFPFMGLPLYVWVDSNRIIRGLTDYLSLTEKNIRSFLSGSHPVLPLKGVGEEKDVDKPLSTSDSGTAWHFRSLLLRYNPGLSLPLVATETEEYTRIAAGNETPLSLILDAVYGMNGSTGNYPYDPLHKRLRNRATGNEWLERDWWSYGREDYDKAEALRAKQSLTYELILPPGYSLVEGYGIMLEEVTRFTRVTAELVPEEIRGWVLSGAAETTLPAGGTGGESASVSDDFLSYSFVNYPVNKLAQFLNCCLNIPLIKDNTGSAGRITLSFRLSHRADTATLIQSLRRGGLTLSRGTFREKVLVIKNR